MVESIRCVRHVFALSVVLSLALIGYPLASITTRNRSVSDVPAPDNRQIYIHATAPTEANHPQDPVLQTRSLSSGERSHSVPLPPPPPPFSFSACLLVKDDNKHLWEWLAYHYTVLPLQNLIIGMDPFSLTTPEPIVEKFRAQPLNMNITLWRESDFIETKPPNNSNSNNNQQPAGQAPQDPQNVTGEQRINEHMERQKTFYTMCARHFKAKLQSNPSWTLFADSDEFLTFNNYHPDEGIPNKCKSRKDKQECHLRFLETVKSTAFPRGRLPAVGTRTVAHYINDELQITREKHNRTDSTIESQELYFKKWPCLCLPRITFGGQESTTDQIQHSVPAGFDAKDFMTLRFRKHKDKQSLATCKSIMDVKRYNGVRFRSLHRVSRKFCNTRDTHPDQPDSLLRIHHYTSSLEAFLSRPGDSHRSEEEYWYRNNFTIAGEDDSVRGWLASFVAKVGIEKALELTRQIRQWAVETEEEMTARTIQRKKELLGHGSDVLV